MKNKLILFDWGNIVNSHLTGYTNIIAWDDLFLKCGYKGNEKIAYSISKYKISSIKSVSEYKKTYEEMKRHYKLNTTFEEYIELYKEIFNKTDYYQDVADYEHSLKSRCAIGIFSNLSIYDKDILDKEVGLSNYDYVFLSFEIGLKKPQKEIYEYVQKSVPFEPNDILFIDDKKENIEVAKEMGWNAFQATGLELDKIKRVCDDFLS